MSPPGAGHNSGISAERLKSFIARLDKLEEERAAIVADVKELYTEVKSAGFDTKIVRELMRMRKLDVEKLREREELLDIYRAAAGME